MSELDTETSTANTEPVEIWFKLIKSSDGYPRSQDWEELWAQPSDRAFTIESIPFFENRVSKGDVVTASSQGDGFLQFVSVVKRSGHSTFRVLVNQKRADVEELVSDLKRMGADCEVTLDHLVAVDVPTAVRQSIEEFLVRGKDAQKWGLQDGFIFEATSI